MAQPSASKTKLPNWQKVLSVAINLAFGVFPAVIFNFWIERNCDYPLLKFTPEWSFLKTISNSLPLLFLWNASLFAVFGFVHVALAQTTPQNYLRRFLPAQTLRTFYMAVTGMCFVWIMSFWQNTGIELWRVPLPKFWSDAISIGTYFACWNGVLVIVMWFDVLLFFGFKQPFMDAKDMKYTGGSSKLITTGLYGIVRHPMYLFMVASYLVAPVMTLDRMFVSVLAITIFHLAIPVEEKKLVQMFGKDYQNYRKSVPALFPKIF